MNRKGVRASRAAAAFGAGLVMASSGAIAQNPVWPVGDGSEFLVEQTNLNNPWFPGFLIGAEFAPNGDLYVWEKDGRVWWVDPTTGDEHTEPLIDLREEVGDWGPHGLMGFALDPDFITNGYFYLFYVVDRNHLLNFGTPEYSPLPDEASAFDASIGRITRYTANADDGFRTSDINSRLVLVGETISTGFPIVNENHGLCGLVFGTDGTLIAGMGDSGSAAGQPDRGGPGVAGAYTEQALIDGIISPKEDVGGYRSQLLDNLNGKLIRIDPRTGDGLPSNPWYDAANPRSNPSRVWALGLRNPFRMSLRPGTGAHDPADGDPGSIFFGDVGWGLREEFNVCNAPGQNFGWPIFEGYDRTSYRNQPANDNLDALNPLFDNDSCTQQYFTFRDLIVDEQEDATYSWPNPCDTGIEITSAPVHYHTRPWLAYGRRPAENGPMEVGTFDFDGNASKVALDAADSPFPNAPINYGAAAMGGVFYTTGPYPEEYHNTYFAGDYIEGWFHSYVFDENDTLTDIQTVHDVQRANGAPGIATVGWTRNPSTGNLFYIHWPRRIKEMFYAPGGNIPPTAIASSIGNLWGPSPLTVNFVGSDSTDPEEGQLTYLWEFGDGQMSTDPNPTHIFTGATSDPESFTVTLTVTDPEGGFTTTQLLVSVNNSPPIVDITSPLDGSLYTMAEVSEVPLSASIIDPEHSGDDLICEWQQILHHDTHTHDEPFQQTCDGTGIITPFGCEAEAIYWYRFTLTVTDAAGLVTMVETEMFPDCSSIAPEANQDDVSIVRGGAALIDVLFNDGDIGNGINAETLTIVGTPLYGTAEVVDAKIRYIHDNSTNFDDQLTYTVEDNLGNASMETTVAITILQQCAADLDGNLIVNIVDLLTYLEKFFADRGDFNLDGVTTVADLLAFLNVWFSGCTE